MIKILILDEANGSSNKIEKSVKEVVSIFAQFLYFKFEKHSKAEIFKCNINKSKVSKVKSFIKDLGFDLTNTENNRERVLFVYNNNNKEEFSYTEIVIKQIKDSNNLVVFIGFFGLFHIIFDYEINGQFRADDKGEFFTM